MKTKPANDQDKEVSKKTSEEVSKKTLWLSVVGIGEEGFEVLLPEARRLCEGARHIFGARRHIERLPKNLQPRAEVWLSPFAQNLAKLDALQKTAQSTTRAESSPPVCVLATGDPLCYGVGVTLVRRYGRTSLRIVPWYSSVSLAAARMGWAHDSFATISLHGRPFGFGLLQRSLAPCARLLVLLSKTSDAERIAGLLCVEHLASAAVTLLSNLGSPDESILCSTAERLAADLAASENPPPPPLTPPSTSDLAIVALELPARYSLSSDSSVARGVFGQRQALPDQAFVHDGQLTKRHVRALTLAALVLQRDALLWDVGAGAGSVAIEWCLAGGRAVAVERHPQRVGFIEQNRARFALEDRLDIVPTSAQDFLLRGASAIQMVRPQAIFVGGGLDKELLERLLASLASDGRLVANAVSLAGESVLSEAYRTHGGELTRIAVAHAQPLGTSHHAFSPQREVVQYVRRV